MDMDELAKKPRADAEKARSGDGVHDKWALHSFAFDYDELPPKFRQYHPGRMRNGELVEGYYDEFIPVAYDSGRGQVLKKDIEWITTTCPECHVAARKTDKGEPMCPECGLICDDDAPTHEIIRDGKAAGRIPEDST